MRRFPDFDFPRPRHRATWPTAPRREVIPDPFLPPEPPPPPERPAPPPAQAQAPEPTLQDERAAHREATAQLEAARARVERDAAKVLDDTRGKLVEQLLPVLDSLDRSIAAGGDAGNVQIRAQLEGVMRNFGLERFEAQVGAPFDPREQEAIAIADVEPARAGTVTAQWDAGYRHAGRLLRPARVQVGRHRS